jgi:membrane dipeptidase
VVDGHDDLVEKIRYRFGNHIYGPDFKAQFERTGLPDHFDLARMKAGMTGGMFFSCWVDCPADANDFSNENYAPGKLLVFVLCECLTLFPVVIEALSQMDVIHRVQAAYPSIFSPAALDSNSALSAFKRHGRFISPIGLEGLHMIGRNASTLRLFHKLGVKYATLTWNCHNAFADAAQVTVLRDPLDPDAARPAPPHWGGLSPLGTKLIHEMNRLGVMVRAPCSTLDKL